jgi:hypothetical protein
MTTKTPSLREYHATCACAIRHCIFPMCSPTCCLCQPTCAIRLLVCHPHVRHSHVTRVLVHVLTCDMHAVALVLCGTARKACATSCVACARWQRLCYIMRAPLQLCRVPTYRVYGTCDIMHASYFPFMTSRHVHRFDTYTGVDAVAATLQKVQSLCHRIQSFSADELMGQVGEPSQYCILHNLTCFHIFSNFRFLVSSMFDVAYFPSFQPSLYPHAVLGCEVWC